MDAQARFSRRNLLRGKINRTPAHRPPWSLPENHFLDQCQRCCDCIDACETHVLIVGSGGFPEANYEQAGCSFCNACVESCSHGALVKHKGNEQKPWLQSPVINNNCLAEQNVHCRTCGDFCEPEAIRFRLSVGGIAKPDIDREQCTGCGECIASCPIKAIAMKSQEAADAA